MQSWFQRIEKDFRLGILYIAGNHDLTHERDPEMAHHILTTGTYLQDSGITIEGVRFWGTPWVSQFGKWAFMGEEDALKEKYDLIPSDTNVLICHGPAYGIRDRVNRDKYPNSAENTGSSAMLSTLFRVKPALFIFGHIHDEYGSVMLNEKTLCCNVATCDDNYEPVHEPVVLDIEDDRLASDEDMCYNGV